MPARRTLLSCRMPCRRLVQWSPSSIGYGCFHCMYHTQACIMAGVQAEAQAKELLATKAQLQQQIAQTQPEVAAKQAELERARCEMCIF